MVDIKKLFVPVVMGKKPYPLIELKNTWYPALEKAASSRACISVVGDSITAGMITTDIDADSFVSKLRTSMQAKYGNGGEGYLTAYHNQNPPLTNHRYTYSTGWTFVYADAKTGQGALASKPYCITTGKTATISFTGDRVQIMTGINHIAGGLLTVTIDGEVKASIDLRGDGNSANLVYGQITEVSGLENTTHTLVLTNTDNPAATNDYGWFEGVRPLIGTTGVVIDRFGKGWLQANWLGVVNEDNPATDYFQSLKAIYDNTLGTHLFIVALGINDYLKQVSLANFDTAMTLIVQRFKTKADVLVLAMPQPNSALTIPYSSYVAKMQTVAAANGAAFLDSRSAFGTSYNASLMADDNHPNDAGHAFLANFLYPYLAR